MRRNNPFDYYIKSEEKPKSPSFTANGQEFPKIKAKTEKHSLFILISQALIIACNQSSELPLCFQCPWPSPQAPQEIQIRQHLPCIPDGLSLFLPLLKSLPDISLWCRACCLRPCKRMYDRVFAWWNFRQAPPSPRWWPFFRRILVGSGLARSPSQCFHWPPSPSLATNSYLPVLWRWSPISMPFSKTWYSSPHTFLVGLE